MELIQQMREAYLTQRRKARHRGLEWDLTLEEWMDIWNRSGRWSQRGRLRGQYQMCRNGDIGPYSVDNVRIDTTDNNIREAHDRTITLRGVTYNSVTEAARCLGVKRPTLYGQMRRGLWD